MKRAMRSFGSLLMTASLGLIGCGGPEGAANQLPTHEVTAKVTVDGKPFGPCQLVMTPEDKAAGLPNSGATLGADGTGKFSTYGPEDGIPAGKYVASLLADSLHVKPMPRVKPLTVTITEEMDGGEVKVDLEATGKMQQSPLPPP